ncbi:hypothetical protein [Nocardioides jensenii]|uniref:hypothetical protein n=1 Tax=Nocardioides jensenii TaxID=1843 RepID=UPI0008350BC5|nr:hypothetical protein [Nocardioides jensenii]
MSAIAATVFVAVSLTGCSEAEKAGNDAKDKAAEAAASAKAEASEKASAKAEEAKGKAKEKAEEAKAKAKAGAGDESADDKAAGDEGTGTGSDVGSGGAGNVTVDLGDFSDDPSAKAVAGFFEARQAAMAAGGEDLSDLEAATTPARFKRVSAVVERNAGKTTPFMVTVVGVEAGSVDVCVGPDGTRARTLRLEGDKVADNTQGDHTCA